MSLLFPVFLQEHSLLSPWPFIFLSVTIGMVQNIIYTGGNSLRSPPTIPIYSNINAATLHLPYLCCVTVKCHF